MTSDLLEIESYIRILYRIRDNGNTNYPSTFTHKQIRVYLECMTDLWEKMELLDTNKADYLQPEIKFLLAALSCRISHEKRTFLAERLIELLELIRKSKPQDYQRVTTDNF